MEYDKDLTMEILYKCHFTAKETSLIMNLSYQTVIARFRALKAIGALKYDRYTLFKENYDISDIHPIVRRRIIYA